MKKISLGWIFGGLVAVAGITSVAISQQGGSGLPGGSPFSTQIQVNPQAFGGVGPGSSGEVLTSNGAGMAPSFQAAAAGGCAPAGMADEVLLDDGAGGCDSLTNGMDGQVLTLDSGAPTWAAAGGGVTSDTFTVTFTTGFTVNQTQNWRYSLIGDMVTLRMVGNVTGTSNSTSFTTSAGAVPLAIRPVANQRFPTVISADNGTNAVSCLTIQPDGTMWYSRFSLGACSGTASWTASGTKTVAITASGTAFSYLIQ